MEIDNTTVKSAYELIKKHDPFIADRLLGNLRHATDDLKLAVDRKREREAEYNASIWQRLTCHVFDVLHQFDRLIEDLQSNYYSCENDIINEAEDTEDRILSHKEQEVEAGNFVYYIVDLDTNVRKTDDKVPVIYSTVEAAEWDCVTKFDTVLSIAEYNRRYGLFMGAIE